MKIDYRIAEVLRVMEYLDKIQKEAPYAKFCNEHVEEGLRLSKTVCAQPSHVVATPLMKNLMVSLGDVTQTEGPDGEIHTSKLEVGKESKAVEFINRVVERCLSIYNGSKRDSYDDTIPILSVEHYNTDCWLGWKPGVWDIVPDMEKSLKEDFPSYASPNTNFSYESIKRLILKSLPLQKAICTMLDELPEVKGSREVRAISDPFMSKKTGVSYPFFKNDSSIVPNGKFKGMTYGKMTIEMVKEKFDKLGIRGLRDIAYENNVYTGYTRRQRGKSRPLRAQSRLTNLVVNMVNGPEMEAWKKIKLGTGFYRPEDLKLILNEMAEFCLKNTDYYLINKDFTSYDKTVGYGWQLLQNALRYMKTNGQLGKSLVEIRHVCATKSQFIDGPNNQVYRIFGRTMSGYDDTTLGNTTISGILGRYGAMLTDEKYSSNVVYSKSKTAYIITLGDDLLGIIKRGTEERFTKAINAVGYKLHTDSKDAIGPMFVQYRLFEDKSGKRVMAYNWPRVLRSMLSKEDAKQLGKAGWTLSFYQQISKCIEYDDSAYILVNIAASLDKEKLMLDTDIHSIKEMVKAEDDERLKKSTDSQKRRMKSTAERLFDGNPQATGSTSEGEIDYDFFGIVQQKLKQLYDPDFWKKIGIAPPNLSKVR